MNKKTIVILVLGVGGNVSQGIIKALRQSQLPIKILGACISEYSKGLYMCDEGYLCPYAADAEFIPWVVRFCKEHKVDLILTGVEENVIKLSQNKELIENETEAVFVSSTYEQIVTGQDKYLTCKFLEESGCNFPAYQLWEGVESTKRFAKKVGFPIIAKPRNGKSAAGIYYLKTDDDVEKYNNLEDYVLEQVVGTENDEYTVGCYVDKNGTIRLLVMQRKLKNGTTIWARTVVDEKIEHECIKICNAFKPVGPLNIQLRLDDSGNPVCFELNVRFSGTTAMRSRFGFQDVKALIKEYVYNADVSDCFSVRTGEVFRYDEEFYLEDGTTTLMKDLSGLSNMHKYCFEAMK